MIYHLKFSLKIGELRCQARRHNCFLPVTREVAMEKGRDNNRCYNGKKNVKTQDDLQRRQWIQGAGLLCRRLNEFTDGSFC